MSPLDAIMGRAKAGMLHGIGVGPGDASLMTLRAAGLIRTVDTLAYFAKAGNKSNARRIAAPLIEAGRKEMPLHYPVTTELSVADPGYKQQIRAFYAEAAAAIAERLRAGESVGLLAEGDPFFYGSFMHMWRRLAADFPVEVIPGVTGFSGCSARAGAPLTWGDDVLTVLPGTLDEATLRAPPRGDRRRGHHENRAQHGEGAPSHNRSKSDRPCDLCRAGLHAGRAHSAPGRSDG